MCFWMSGCIKTHQVVLTPRWRGLDLLSPAQMIEMVKKKKNWRQKRSVCTLHENRQQRWASPRSTPSSVNDSYSACVVVYSFPAVKGCPLKVPFVQRLHFVIQITPLLFRTGERKKRVGPKWTLRQLSLPPPSKWIPSIVPPLYPILLFIYICTYIYMVQKETGVN